MHILSERRSITESLFKILYDETMLIFVAVCHDGCHAGHATQHGLHTGQAARKTEGPGGDT